MPAKPIALSFALSAAVVFGAAASVFSSSVQAARYDYLSKSVLGEFNPEDVVSFRARVAYMLENEAEHETVMWAGPSGLKGKMRIEVGYEADGIPCKRLRFAFLNRHENKEFYKVDVCKQAGNWQIMETPFASFSEEEVELLHQQVSLALEEGETDHPISWSFPPKQSGGVVVPFDAMTINGKGCRRAAISIYDKSGRSSGGTYLFCQTDEKEWQREVEQ